MLPAGAARNGDHVSRPMSDYEINQTRDLIANYIYYRMTSRRVRSATSLPNTIPVSNGDSDLQTDSSVPPLQALQNSQIPTPSPEQEKLRSCLHSLADDFEARYADSMGNLSSDAGGLGENSSPKDTYAAVLSELFHDHINWGRIVAMFAFSAAMSARAISQGRPDLIASYLQWTLDHVRNRLWPWIVDHGGWSGLLTLGNNIENEEAILWASAKKIAKVCAGTFGLYAIARFFSNRV